MLRYNGEVWLPNIPCINGYIQKNTLLLEKFYTITLCPFDKIRANPLVTATDDANLSLISDTKNPFHNGNQLNKLNKENPFYLLKFIK